VADGTVTWTIPIQVSVRIGALPAGLDAMTIDLAPQIDPAPASPATASAAGATRMAKALAELERGRALPYYSQTADETARAAYYRDLPAQRTDAAFFPALHELAAHTHTATPR